MIELLASLSLMCSYLPTQQEQLICESDLFICYISNADLSRDSLDDNIFENCSEQIL